MRPGPGGPGVGWNTLPHAKCTRSPGTVLPSLPAARSVAGNRSTWPPRRSGGRSDRAAERPRGEATAERDCATTASARFLALHVRGVLTLEEGIRSMSSLMAERLGLRDRGRLQPGPQADTTIFDRERIESRGTIEKPREYATRIVHALVNGRLAIRCGQRTDDDGGEVLRP